jgi:hypothetical protein
MALAAGSIAFLGFNADGTDGFAILAIDALPAGTVLRFSDNEWNGQPIGAGGAFNTGEGGITWTVGAAISAGTAIEFLNVSDLTTRSVNLGALTGGTLALGNSGEAIFAFQGPSEASATNFLAAVTNNNGGFSGATTSGLLAGTGLIAGETALVLPGTTGAGRGGLQRRHRLRLAGGGAGRAQRDRQLDHPGCDGRPGRRRHRARRALPVRAAVASGRRHLQHRRRPGRANPRQLHGGPGQRPGGQQLHLHRDPQRCRGG